MTSWRHGSRMPWEPWWASAGPPQPSRQLIGVSFFRWSVFCILVVWVRLDDLRNWKRHLHILLHQPTSISVTLSFLFIYFFSHFILSFTMEWQHSIHFTLNVSYFQVQFIPVSHYLTFILVSCLLVSFLLTHCLIFTHSSFPVFLFPPLYAFLLLHFPFLNSHAPLPCRSSPRW